MEGVEKDKTSLGLKKGAKTEKANYESLRSSFGGDVDKVEEFATMESKRSDNSAQNKSSEEADDRQLVHESKATE